MKPINDWVYVYAEKEKKRTMTYGSLTLYKDIAFRPYDAENCIQDGIVAYAPAKTRTNEEVRISPGDKVYCHHFLCHPDNEAIVDEKKMYRIDYLSSIYCRVSDGQIIMLNGWNFIEPIADQDKVVNGLWRPKSKKAKTGVAKYICDELKEQGVRPGDTIYFLEDSDYEIIVEEELLWRIKTDRIIGICEVNEDI